MELVSELKETILLNKYELLLLIKEYSIVYLISLFKDYRNIENRKVLREKIKEYYAIIKEENSYAKFQVETGIFKRKV